MTTLFPSPIEIIMSIILEHFNQTKKCYVQSSPFPVQIYCPLWYRRLVEIHRPITPHKCKGWRDEQRKTAGGEGGSASYFLMLVFKPERSSSAWEKPKLPIPSNLSSFCPSARLPAHGRSGMLSHTALGLTWSTQVYIWKLGHVLEEDLCAAQIHLGNPTQQQLG